MPKTKNNNAPDVQISELGDEIKKQFDKIGAEVKDQLMKDFNKVLTNDLSNLKSTLGKIVEAQNQKIVKQSQLELQKALKMQFSGSILGELLGDAVMPAVFGSTDNNMRSSDFRAAVGQSLLEIGRSIARSQSRNG